MRRRVGPSLAGGPTSVVGSTLLGSWEKAVQTGPRVWRTAARSGRIGVWWRPDAVKMLTRYFI